MNHGILLIPSWRGPQLPCRFCLKVVKRSQPAALLQSDENCFQPAHPICIVERIWSGMCEEEKHAVYKH